MTTSARGISVGLSTFITRRVFGQRARRRNTETEDWRLEERKAEGFDQGSEIEGQRSEIGVQTSASAERVGETTEYTNDTKMGDCSIITESFSLFWRSVA